jgi:hypothetical protein
VEIAVAAWDRFGEERAVDATMGEQLARGLQLAVFDDNTLITAIRR